MTIIVSFESIRRCLASVTTARSRRVLDGAKDPADDPAAWRGLLGIVIDLLQTKRQTLRRALAFTSKIERLGGAERALKRFRIDVEEIETEFREGLR